MLSDYWVITLLLAQFFSLLLISNATWFAYRIIRGWSREMADERQINLERQTYLIASICQFVLIFQIGGLVIFLQTANLHLPQIIKGAMCATGTLGAVPGGYTILYLKAGGVLLYALFLMMNFLDNQEPNYPLTPRKYFLLFPILALQLFDFYYNWLYFSGLEPDIIATCCSVSFMASQAQPGFLGATTDYISYYLLLWRMTFLCLFVATFLSWIFQKSTAPRSRHWTASWWSLLHFLGAGMFVYTSIYTLKHFFVKYIYGLPTHNCLFDIFWAKYYYIGFGLFGAYYGVLLSSLFLWVIRLFGSELKQDLVPMIKKAQTIHLLSLLFAFIIPLLYWILWRGNL
ncbi:MAG: hypothetical protein AAFU64_04475 [Bacteroidota bacterium]